MRSDIVVRDNDRIEAGQQAQGYNAQSGKEIPLLFIAPIDMMAGDVCMVDLTDGTLFSIERDGISVWIECDGEET